MKFVVHQLRTDLLHLRGWLLAWLLLLVAATIVAAVRLDMLAGSQESAGRLLGAHAFLLDALVVMSWVLAARVIHADPLDGTTAFWVTRPVSPARLAAAKLVSILLLFVVVPTALAAAAAAANGLRGPLLARACAESALVHLAFVLGIVLLATLTRDVARLVLAGIAAAALWVSLRAVFHYTALGAGDALERTLPRYSGLLVGLLACCAGCLAIVVGQFLSRKARRSVVLALVLTLGVIGLVDSWRWDVLGLQQAVRPGSFDGPAWRLSLREGRRGGLSPSESFVQGRFLVEQAPAGWAVIPLHIDATLRLEDGTGLPFADDTWLASAGLYNPSAVFGLGGQAFDAASALLPGRWLNEPRGEANGGPHGERGHGVSITLMKLPGGISARHATRGEYEAIVMCSAYRARVVARVPCRGGALLRLDGSETMFLGLREALTAGGSSEVRLDVRTATFPLLFPRLGPAIVHVLLNRPRGERLIGIDQSSIGPSLRLLGGGGLQVRYGEILFFRGNQPLKLDPGWMADAELAAVAFEPQGVFTRRMTIADFRLREEAAAAEKE